jgi:pimeloyl-ACP methyl ester carboxylesterase
MPDRFPVRDSRFPAAANRRFVVLPGLDGTGLLLQSFAAALRSCGDVEIRGYPTQGPQDHASLAAAMAPVGAGDVLVAESFGGPLAIALAAQAAAAPRALVLCASFATSPRPWLRPLAPLLRGLSSRPGSLASLLRRPVAALLFGRWATAELNDALGQALAAVPAWVLRARLQAVLDVDMAAALRALRCPLLYLRANSDRLVPAAAAATIARLRPDTVRVDLDAPHGLLQTAAQTAVEAIGQFLAAQVAASAAHRNVAAPVEQGGDRGDCRRD